MNEPKVWKNIIESILATEEMILLKEKLDEERKMFDILPDSKNLFNAFSLCPYEKTKVVILAQDPYPDKKHAHGLAFSSIDQQTPASLSNIFKEIHDELYPNEAISEVFKSNNLTSWAEQGILLINSVLTVRAGMAGSHRDLGWDVFTKAIMTELNNSHNDLVFLFWGNDAKKYASYIDNPRHLTLFSSHPSPLSVERGFFGNMHFREVNTFLRRKFYEKLSNAFRMSVDMDRLKRKTDEFFFENSIEIKEGSISTIYDVMFDDIGLFFDALFPELRKKYEINWRT